MLNDAMSTHIIHHIATLAEAGPNFVSSGDLHVLYMRGYKTTQNQYLLSQARAASTHNMPSQQIMRAPNLSEVARRVSCLLG